MRNVTQHLSVYSILVPSSLFLLCFCLYKFVMSSHGICVAMELL